MTSHELANKLLAESDRPVELNLLVNLTDDWENAWGALSSVVFREDKVVLFGQMEMGDDMKAEDGD